MVNEVKIGRERERKDTDKWRTAKEEARRVCEGNQVKER